MKYLSLFLILICIIFTHNSSAKNFRIKCNKTPELSHSIIPDVFTSSNNLTKYSESLFSAHGKVIYISGKVVDENCVPVIGALISIWQTNANGYYQFNIADKQEEAKNNPNIKNDPKKSAPIISPSQENTKKSFHPFGKPTTYDAYFIGTGSAITDNLGYYNFKTIMPGVRNDDVPHISFMITHSDFAPLETKMFFDDNEDDDFIDLEKAHQKLLIAKTSDKINYKFNITFKGKNKYLQY